MDMNMTCLKALIKNATFHARDYPPRLADPCLLSTTTRMSTQDVGHPRGPEKNPWKYRLWSISNKHITKHILGVNALKYTVTRRKLLGLLLQATLEMLAEECPWPFPHHLSASIRYLLHIPANYPTSSCYPQFAGRWVKSSVLWMQRNVICLPSNRILHKADSAKSSDRKVVM